MIEENDQIPTYRPKVQNASTRLPRPQGINSSGLIIHEFLPKTQWMQLIDPKYKVERWTSTDEWIWTPAQNQNNRWERGAISNRGRMSKHFARSVFRKLLVLPHNLSVLKMVYVWAGAIDLQHLKTIRRMEKACDRKAWTKSPKKENLIPRLLKRHGLCNTKLAGVLCFHRTDGHSLIISSAPDVKLHP